MGIRTTYDGGKVMGGYGMFTGTTTAAWMLKAFGSFKCTAAVAVPAGYVAFALTGGVSLTTCQTMAVWIWT